MDTHQILPNFRGIPLLFVGEVVGLGPEPPSWSGRIPAYQTVEYRVVDELKGKAPGPNVSVLYSVVRGSPFARADRPGLSPEYFQIGGKLVVGVEDRAQELHNAYIQPWSEELVRELEGALRQ